MTAGRKPLPAATAGTDVVIREDVLAADAKALNEITAGQQMVMDSAESFTLAGRIQAAHFMETVSSRMIVETYIKIKNSKAYKGLPYKTPAGKVEIISTLEEFCDAYMPRSRRRCEQLADSYQLLGPDLYEQAEAIGFRQRDYSALKALPADDQAVVKQAIEAGKLDNAIELMQEMAVRHHAQKAELEKVASESTDNYAALDLTLKKTIDRADRAEREADKLRHRLTTATPDDVGKQLRQEVAGLGHYVEGQINDNLLPAFDALAEHAALNDCSHDEFMSGVLFAIERALLALREKHGVKARPDGDERPDWTREDYDADAVVAAALANTRPVSL